MPAIQNVKFILLLLSLVGLLVFPGYFSGEAKSVVTGSALSAAVFAFVMMVVSKKWERTIALIFLVPVMLLNWQWGDKALLDLLIWLNLLFYLFVIYELMKFVMSQRKVDFNIISAAISVYFFIGILWALIYSLIETSYPGAIESVSDSSAHPLSHFIYFSFVTMSTLGYGDISPHIPIAQNWVILQTIVGQFYMAVVMARIVAIYSSNH